jgi:hypothetical protein
MFCQIEECSVMLWNVENGHPMMIQFQNRSGKRLVHLAYISGSSDFSSEEALS